MKKFCIGVLTILSLILSLVILANIPMSSVKASSAMQITESPDMPPTYSLEQTSTPGGPTVTPWPITNPRDQIITDQLLYALSVYVVDGFLDIGKMEDPDEINVYDHNGVYVWIAIAIRSSGLVNVFAKDNSGSTHFWDCQALQVPLNYESITPWYNKIKWNAKECKYKGYQPRGVNDDFVYAK